MNTTLAYRNIFAALVLVPTIALAGVVAEPFAGKSAAEAQVSTRAPNNRPGANPKDDPDSDPVSRSRLLRPCPPGVTTIVGGANCRPWTPPRFTAASKEDCSCHVTYKTINGQRVATKDCYVLLPTDEVYYCKNPSVIR